MASPVETTADEITQRLSLNIKGKVILTTGVSPGSLGAAFVETLASTAQPKLLILAGRNKSKVEATAKAIDELGTKVPTRILQLDLASLQNVRAAAAIVNGYDEPIDVLVNNAGVMACDYSTTVDGLECQFGTNHLGPWLFTNLIVNKVLSSPEGGRIVNVASDGYRLSPIRFHDYGFHVSSYVKKVSTIDCVSDLPNQGGRIVQQVSCVRSSEDCKPADGHVAGGKARSQRFDRGQLTSWCHSHEPVQASRLERGISSSQ